MTKQQIIAELKSEFPTLRIGDDDAGYTELSNQEYQTIIEQWADAKFKRLAKESEIEAKAQAKAELLERLGITEDEAKLLLA